MPSRPYELGCQRAAKEEDIRWADDIVVLCRTVKEAKEARAHLEKILLPAGMPLKGPAEESVRRLAKGQPALWLGYSCQIRQNELAVELAPDSIPHLAGAPARSQFEPNFDVLAEQVIQGWITQAGPAYTPTYAKTVCKGIVAMLQDAGLGQVSVCQPDGGTTIRLASSRWMLAVWKKSHRDWLIKRNMLAVAAEVAAGSGRKKRAGRASKVALQGQKGCREAE